MTPKAALEIVRMVADRFVGTKRDHAMVEEAIDTMRKLVEIHERSTSVHPPPPLGAEILVEQK